MRQSQKIKSLKEVFNVFIFCASTKMAFQSSFWITQKFIPWSVRPQTDSLALKSPSWWLSWQKLKWMLLRAEQQKTLNSDFNRCSPRLG